MNALTRATAETSGIAFSRKHRNMVAGRLVDDDLSKLTPGCLAAILRGDGSIDFERVSRLRDEGDCYDDRGIPVEVDRPELAERWGYRCCSIYPAIGVVVG